MAHDRLKEQSGHLPVTLCQLELDRCTRDYAVGPCQAGAVQTGTAQAGGASTITLAAAASAVDDAYNGMRVAVTGGTGAGQERAITDYVGSTRVATVDSPWATAPDATSAYAVKDPASADACYRTRSTCQDGDNFDRGSIAHGFGPLQPVIPGIDYFPCVESVRTAPTRITPGEGLGERARVQITLRDQVRPDTLAADPYRDQRAAPAEGTYLGRLLARNRYTVFRPLRTYSGYLVKPFDLAGDYDRRDYLVDRIRGPDRRGRWHIIAKDPLKQLDDDAAKLPAATNIELTADVTAVATTLPVDDASAVSPGDYIRWNDEIVKVGAVSGNDLTGCTRGTWGSEPDAHETGDSGQLCYWAGDDPYGASPATENAVDVIRNMIAAAGVDTATYIDGAEWEAQRDTWCTGSRVAGIVSEPTGVNTLVGELTVENLLDLWWDERAQRISVRSLFAHIRATGQDLDDTRHFLRDSVEVWEDAKDRISRVIVHYGLRDYTEEPDADTTRYTYVVADLGAESAPQHGAEAIREIASRWFVASDLGAVISLAGRLLGRFRDPPKRMKFALHAKDSSLWTGDAFTARTRHLPGVTGADEATRMQVLSAQEREAGHRYEYEAMQLNFSGRYAFVAPAGTPDYSAATDEQRALYGYVAPSPAGFSDGGEPYKVI